MLMLVVAIVAILDIGTLVGRYTALEPFRESQRMTNYDSCSLGRA